VPPQKEHYSSGGGVLTEIENFTETFVSNFMENLKFDSKLETIFNQTFPSAQENMLRDFKSDVLTDKIPFLRMIEIC